MIWLLFLVAYGLPLLAFSLAIAWKQGWSCGLCMLVVFPALHLSHGAGCLRGLLDFFILRRTATIAAKDLPITR
jgi:hypothetical protein